MPIKNNLKSSSLFFFVLSFIGVLFVSAPRAEEMKVQLKPSAKAKAVGNEKTALQKKIAPTSVLAKKNKVNPSGQIQFEKSDEGQKIVAIDIIGNKKIERDAILNRLVSKEQMNYSATVIREDILSLFRSNYFLNVEVEKTKVDGGFKLTYRLQEKPSITEIEFDGFVELKKEEVSDASGLKVYEIFNPQRLKEAQEKIQKFYEDKGFFLAKVEYVVEDIKKDESVKVTFKIQENEKVKVKKITFLGNKKLSDALLKDRIQTKEQGFFSGMSGSGAYKQDAFQRDVQILHYVYFNMGYVRAQIDRPQVYVTPDRKGIYITIRIEEGELFNVGEVDFSGDLLFAKDELFEVTKIDDNGVFAYDVLQKDLAELQAKYGDLGYAYANVEPKTRFRDQDRKVDLVFDFQKGNKVYFGKINMVGNSKTRDKVLRREMKIVEGELYNETRRRESLENIQRLGFFEEVNFKTFTPEGSPDIMDIDITVKERNTGQIQAGAGYGTTQGFTLQGSVQQTNFYGYGQNLGVSLNYSKNYSVYDVSFTEPYVNDTLWSLGGRVFQSNNTGRTDYNELKSGASISVGHPLGDKFRGNLTYGYTRINLDPAVDPLTGNILTDQDLFPLDTASGDAGTISASLEYDSRNDRFRPTRGHYGRLGYSYTGLGGNLKYYKGNADYRYFKNLFWDVVWRNSFQYAKIDSLDSSKDVPFNELYLLGGPYTLRGFRYFRVGKMKRSQKLYDTYIANPATANAASTSSMRFFGGTQQFLYQSEFQFPLIKEADMFGVAFYDIGQADDTLSPDGFSSDVGFGIRWFSPLGPLRFEWGFPLVKDATYNPENMVFEFSIGTPF